MSAPRVFDDRSGRHSHWGNDVALDVCKLVGHDRMPASGLLVSDDYVGRHRPDAHGSISARWLIGAHEFSNYGRHAHAPGRHDVGWILDDNGIRVVEQGGKRRIRIDENR